MATRPPVRRPARPVSRLRVAVVTALLALAVAGVVALAEALRHPPAMGAPVATPDLEADDADVALPLDCPEPVPREGQERDVDAPPTRTPIDVSAVALIDCPQAYSGVRVRYEGEVVGAVLRRDDGAWLHVNDDNYAGDAGPLPGHRDFAGGNAGVGVFVPLDAVADIEHVGGPDARGDRVAVTGVFRRVDPVSGEVAVIRADSLEVVRSGEPFRDPLLMNRLIVAVAVAVITSGVFVVERVTTRRAREAGALR